MKQATILMGLALACAVAMAQPTIDGRNIPSEFGTALASQTNYTGFGDHTGGVTWGSELDQLFVRCEGGVLYIGVTGNLEGNGNAFHFYIDTGRNPNNTFTLTTGCINCSVQGMSGVVFDHQPDWVLGVNRYDDGQGNDNIYVDLHDLVSNVSTYLGSAPTGTGDGTLTGGDNTVGVRAALDNSNEGGITSDPNNLGDPSTVTTGMEVAIPLSALGNPSGRIRILVVLTGGADLGDPCHGTYMSNQTLPALNIGDPSQQFPNVAWVRCPDPPFDSFPFSFQVSAPGVQYVEIDPCPTGPEGDVNGDGCVDDADLLMVLFAFGCSSGCGAEDVNGDGTVDDADLLIVLFNFGQGC
ncbi:hypothetical protein HRbin15_02619 [bacterium HR15]|nr:hypothetical protein HRbin15_02619 [bacterium HR15]